MRSLLLVCFSCLLLSALAQRSSFENTGRGQLMLKTTDSLVDELQKQGYTILMRIDTFAQCYDADQCISYLNNYITDKVSGVFCLTTNYNGVRLDGVPSDRNKLFKANRWDVTPWEMHNGEVTASVMSWEGILDELFPHWNFFSYIHNGEREYLSVLFVSAPDKAKQNAYFARLRKPVQTIFSRLNTKEETDRLKERKEWRDKDFASLSPEGRKTRSIMDSIDNQYGSMYFGCKAWFDTLFKEGQSITVDEQMSKMDENIFFLVSKAPLDQVEVKGTPFEAWSPTNTEIFKDITSRSKGYFIRRIHMIGSIKKITVSNNGSEPIRVQVHHYNSSFSPIYLRSKEWFAELAYARKQEELSKARELKAKRDAQIAAREKEQKEAGVVCYNCNGTGVEYIYSKCFLCGGDGQTTQFVTGSKTVGQIKTFKGNTVSGNEIYEVRDNKMVTVEGKQLVTCSMCKGEGATKTNKTRVCHICNGNKKLYK